MTSHYCFFLLYSIISFLNVKMYYCYSFLIFNIALGRRSQRHSTQSDQLAASLAQLDDNLDECFVLTIDDNVSKILIESHQTCSLLYYLELER